MEALADSNQYLLHSVIASEARQSSVMQIRSGLPRRCAPRNDDGSYCTKAQMKVVT